MSSSAFFWQTTWEAESFKWILKNPVSKHIDIIDIDNKEILHPTYFTQNTNKKTWALYTVFNHLEDDPS